MGQIDPDLLPHKLQYPEHALGPKVPRWIKFLRLVTVLSPLVMGIISEITDPDINPISDSAGQTLGPINDLVVHRE